MSKIRIRNFGPIKEGNQEDDGWIDVNKVTIFIGNQGSGKSTVAKTISTMSWLEKSLNRGDIKNISSNDFCRFFEYQRIRHYFKENSTYIEYIGDAFHIIYEHNNKPPIIKKTDSLAYIVPQIIYIPAERNFLSTISEAFKVKGLPENLFSFAEELRKAQQDLNGKKIELPIGNYVYEYNEFEKASYISESDYRINITEASSGLQSFIPLYIVSKSLSYAIYESQNKENRSLNVDQAVRLSNEIMDIMNDNSLSGDEKATKANRVRNKYFNKCFYNIVEEPEQNLFPSSQWEMLKSLLEFNNMTEGNKLLMTTHSPYIINYLSVAIQANFVKKKISEENSNLFKALNKIVPAKSTVQATDVSIYQFDEKKGSLKKLPHYEGIPSDKNYLNESLDHGNKLFDKLFEIEEEL